MRAKFLPVLCAEVETAMQQKQGRSEEEMAPGIRRRQTHARMAELQAACEREIKEHRERATLAASSFRQSLHSLRSSAQQTLESREKLGKLKDCLRELEADLGESLAAKTGKVSKSTSLSETLSLATSRTEQLKKMLVDQRRKRDQCAAVISEQLVDLEEKSIQHLLERKNIEEVMIWYNQILGFQVQGGEGGVKFIFSKVDLRSPDVEYSFVLKLDNDVYKLLRSDPLMEGTTEMIQELNKTNELFRFVRTMREKFQVAASHGVSPESVSACPDLSVTTMSSPPPFSVETFKKRGPLQSSDHQFEFSKDNLGKVSTPSPQSITCLRRSPRLIGKRTGQKE